MSNLPLIVINSSKTSKLFTWTSTVSAGFILLSSLNGISWSLISSVVFPAPSQPTMIPLVWLIFICPFFRNSLNSWKLIVAASVKFVFVTIFFSDNNQSFSCQIEKGYLQAFCTIWNNDCLVLVPFFLFCMYKHIIKTRITATHSNPYTQKNIPMYTLSVFTGVWSILKKRYA